MVLYSQYPKLSIASGYASRMMCSCTFVQGRDKDEIIDHQLYFSPLNLMGHDIDFNHKTVTSSLFGLAPTTSKYKEGIGCMILIGEDDYKVSAPSSSTKIVDFDFPLAAWNIADSIMANHQEPEDLTQALLVIHQDSVVYEYYAKHFDRDTPILGWSMTKSVTGALIGMRVDDGLLSLDQDNLFSHWTDDRKHITIDNLLQMNSGLAWEEEYADVSLATKMLFKSENTAATASKTNFEYPIGQEWEYSSGTTNMLSGILRSTFDDHEDYLSFPKDSLFAKLGMVTAFIECDESGNFIGSSYMYASARDWAKFGRLYLREGLAADSTRVLSKEWVDYSTKPNSLSKGRYGGHFWFDTYHEEYPDVKDFFFSANGFQGQHVFVFPGLDLMIIRLGAKDIDFNVLLKDVIAQIKNR